MIERRARAKVNLALHVTGVRADGYHLLDSLVCFAEVADDLRVLPAKDLSLTIDGPFGADLPVQTDNLVLRAARMLGGNQGAEIHLTKNLPIAAGIGGGSADAAAAILALAALWGRDIPSVQALTGLGADVPVCVAGGPTRVEGVGDRLKPITQMPELSAVLVNPRRALATSSVFAATREKENPGLTAFPSGATPLGWIDYISCQRNDLSDAAMSLLPEIGSVIAELAAFLGCRVARMSGSGATCFGVFEDDATASSASQQIAAAHPNWWVQHTRLLGSGNA